MAYERIPFRLGVLEGLSNLGYAPGVCSDHLRRMVLRNDGLTIEKVKKNGFSFSMKNTEQWCFFHHKLSLSHSSWCPPVISWFISPLTIKIYHQQKP